MQRSKKLDTKYSALFAFIFTYIALAWIAPANAASQVDVAIYVPAASAPSGYVSFLRISNIGNAVTDIKLALIDDATGTAASPVPFIAVLAAGAATTFSAAQIEAALGAPVAAAQRPRIRVIASADTAIEVQSFLLQPGGVFNEISGAASGASVDVRSYVPAAAAPSGYVSYMRVINSGANPATITVARIDPATGLAGNAATLNSQLPAGAAITYTAAQMEAALGININAAERPRLRLSGVGTTLTVQSFLIQPGGAFTEISTGQTGSTIDVRSYIPAKVIGYTSFIRVINTSATATNVIATIIDDATGLPSASGTVVTNLAASEAITLPSQQIEAAIGVAPDAGSRPRLRLFAPSGSLDVQSFLLQPGGAFNEVSNAVVGTDVNVRTYVPAADAVTGYTSYIRVINPNASATPVFVALIDAATGVAGSPMQLLASLPAGAAKTFNSTQIEAALAVTIASGVRPRLSVSGNFPLEVQSFLTQPGGAFTEVSGATVDGGTRPAINFALSAKIGGVVAGNFSPAAGQAASLSVNSGQELELDSTDSVTWTLVANGATATLKNSTSLVWDATLAASTTTVLTLKATSTKDPTKVALVTVNLQSAQTNLVIRHTGFGNVAGTPSSRSASIFWGGIPYAAPPLGALRWKAPTDPTPWTTTLTTIAPGNACMQAGSVTDALLGLIAQSEDCLTLNIWSPASGETNLPVLVYVHGGSNIGGYGGYNDQWGGVLASEQKVVFVSINYRVNLFGWLNHAALKTGDVLSDSGNFGTLDIAQALKFVKNNIANFGGDPTNVTLAGQSAGANNVWTMIASPQASGLFHKAMPMSGGLATLSSTSNTPAAGQTFANTLLQQLVMRDGLATSVAGASAYLAGRTNAQIKDYLYSQSAASLIGMLSNPVILAVYGGIPPNRFMDGVVLPPDYATAFTGSFVNNVPVLAGNVNEEGKYWGSYFAVSGKWSALASFNPDNPTLVIEDVIQPQYLPANKAFANCSNAGYNALILNSAFVYTNSATYCSNLNLNTTYFWWNQTTSLNRLQPLQPKIYAYNFAWAQQPEPIKTIIGSAHATDIGFMFGNIGQNTGGFSYGYSTANAAGRTALSSVMRASLGAFMRTGNPNNGALGATWLPWSAASGGINRLIFDADYNNANITMSGANTQIPR